MDYSIVIFFNQLSANQPWLNGPAIFLAQYLPYMVVAGLALLLLINFKKYLWPIAQAFLSAGLALAIARAIRFFVLKPRPLYTEGIIALLNHKVRSGFPSVHSVIFFAIATIILLYNKKLGLIFFVSACLIGLGRIFTALHWPSDILAGMTIGILSALFINFFWQKFWPKIQQKFPQLT